MKNKNEKQLVWFDQKYDYFWTLEVSGFRVGNNDVDN